MKFSSHSWNPHARRRFAQALPRRRRSGVRPRPPRASESAAPGAAKVLNRDTLRQVMLAREILGKPGFAAVAAGE